MKRIIVNADDFGRHTGINEAVIKGFKEGCISSASIMAGCPGFAEAAELARQNPELGIGIHLTVVAEEPVLPAERVPSLVKENGRFYDDYVQFAIRLMTGRVNLAEVKAELTAQVNKVKAEKLNITHIDSHQHMHVLPGMIDIALDLAQQNNIKAVRIPAIPVGFTGGYSVAPAQLVGRGGLAFLAKIARWKAKRRGFKTPEHFGGIVAGESVNEECLLEIVNTMPDGVTEVMMHPGISDAVLQPECGWLHGFEAEFAAVCSPQVMQAIKQQNIKLINFSQL